MTSDVHTLPTRRGALAALLGGTAAAALPVAAAAATPALPAPAPEPDPFIIAYKDWVAACDAYVAAKKAYRDASKGLPSYVHGGWRGIALSSGKGRDERVFTLTGREWVNAETWDSVDHEGDQRVLRYIRRHCAQRSREIADLRKRYNLDALSEAESEAQDDMHLAMKRMRTAIPTTALGVALAARIYVAGISSLCPDHVPVFAGAVALVPEGALDAFGPVPNPYGG